VEDQGKWPGGGALPGVAVEAESGGLHGPVLPQDPPLQLIPEAAVEGRPGGSGFLLKRRGTEGAEDGFLYLSLQGEQAGGHGLIAVEPPDASGEEGGQDRAAPLVGDGGTPVEQIAPVPLQEAQDRLTGDTALRHPAVRELVALPLEAELVDAAAEGFPDLRGAGAELGKCDAHRRALLCRFGPARRGDRVSWIWRFCKSISRNAGV